MTQHADEGKQMSEDRCRMTDAFEFLIGNMASGPLGIRNVGVKSQGFRE
jgi:hypothetical protein